MPFSISFKFQNIILGLVDGPPNPHGPHRSSFMLLSDRVSEAAGVELDPYKPGSHLPARWHMMPGYFIRLPPAERAELNKNYPRRFGVEFISPNYREANSAEWKDNLSLMFNTIGEYAYWMPNPTSSLNTCLRLRQGEKFTLPQLKRIAMLVCRFEEAIDILPPVRRMLANSKLTLSNRFDNPAFRNHTLPEIYSLIQAASTISQLCRLINKKHKNENRVQDSSGMCFHKTLKVNFAGKTLIRFFQYENTVSAEAAIKWAEFLLRFVGYAMSASDADVMSGGTGIEDLARLVSLP